MSESLVYSSVMIFKTTKSVRIQLLEFAVDLFKASTPIYECDQVDDYGAYVYEWVNLTKDISYIGYKTGCVDDIYICSTKDEVFWRDFYDPTYTWERRILSLHPTKKLAVAAEARVHRERKVGNNPKYYNVTGAHRFQVLVPKKYRAYVGYLDADIFYDTLDKHQDIHSNMRKLEPDSEEWKSLNLDIEVLWIIVMHDIYQEHGQEEIRKERSDRLMARRNADREAKEREEARKANEPKVEHHYVSYIKRQSNGGRYW